MSTAGERRQKGGIQVELGKAIKKLRAQQGWSQEVLAEKAFVSRQTVSNWETEKSYPDVHSLLILSSLFGVSLDELIKGDVELMKETVHNEDRGALKKLQVLGVLGLLALMYGCTALFEYGGEAGRLLGCMLAGGLAVGIFLTFHRMEQIKQKNDIQTYREVLAFLNGETLDDIEKAKEQQKRMLQKRLTAAVAVFAGAALVFCAVTVVPEIIR